MSKTNSGHALITICRRSISKTEAINGLLLSDDVRPPSYLVANSHSYFESIAKASDCSILVGELKSCIDFVYTILPLVASLLNSIANVSVTEDSLDNLCSIVENMGKRIEKLTDMCVSVGYYMALSLTGCRQASPGTVDVQRIKRAGIELSLGVEELQNSNVLNITPLYIVTLCSNMSENLSVIIECLKAAAVLTERSKAPTVIDDSIRKQLVCCIDNLISSGTCFMNSAKILKKSPTDLHLQHCCGFYEALVSCSASTIFFVSQKKLAGKPAFFTPQALNVFRGILGMLNLQKIVL